MNSLISLRNISKNALSKRGLLRTFFTDDKGIPTSFRKFHSSNVTFSEFRKSNQRNFRTNSIRNYVVAITLLTLGASYAAVPLYGVFCQVTGYGGTIKREFDESKLKSLKKNKSRKITVQFNSDVASTMAWKFKPQQQSIQVVPGETALAFYTALNPTDKPIIGVSTYNVVPFEAGPYFNKIQCFCFEEQILNPHEQVDMPVFFYIDPEYCEDPRLENVDDIMLSYTFFEAREGMKLPIPGFLMNKKE